MTQVLLIHEQLRQMILSLDLGPGERLTIVNPNPVEVTGSYKLDLQGAIK